MASTFFGLEIARRALFTQQSALRVTGHNIANANTEGYTRQRVDFRSTSPYPAAARNRPEIPGQMGTGVEAGQIERVRNSFLDIQYRTENNKLGYYEARSSTLKHIEDILNEPTEDGLNATFNRFWESLQDLADHPTDSGARSVVTQRGAALASTFNYLSTSINTIQGNLQDEIGVNVDQVNSLLSQIHALNKQIGEVEPHGYLPNDLYDKRDLLIDELSSMMNVKVTYTPSGGNDLSTAMGKAVIQMTDAEGNVIPNATLIDLDNQLSQLDVNFNADGIVNSVTVGGDEIISDFMGSRGKLLGLVEMNGYDTGGGVQGQIPEMLAEIDQLAFEFASQFNGQHQQGYTLEDSNNDGVLENQGGPFFAINGSTDLNSLDTDGDGTVSAAEMKGFADVITVHDDIMADEKKVAAALPSADGFAYSGDGSNALELADLKDSAQINGTSIQSFYEGIIGKLAVDTEEASRMTGNSGVLRQSVEQKRQSVSGVSLDEEMANLVKFQHAYNAAARNITVVDEMLDRIINQMGIVGR